MNISGLKSEFWDYMVQNQKVESPEKDENYDVSIFKYSSDFKDFLKEEYNILPADISISYLANFDFSEILSDSEDDTETDSVDVSSDVSSAESSSMSFVKDLLSKFFNDKSVMEFSDLDENGELSDKEIKAVIKTITGKDGNIDNLSLEDLTSLYEVLNPSSEDELPYNINDTQDISSRNYISSNIQKENTYYPAGNVSANKTGNFESNVSKTKQKELSTKNLDEMTYDELVDTQSIAQAQYINANKELTAILDGENAQLLKEEVQVQFIYDTYEEELAKLDEEEASKLKDFKTQIDSKENEIDENDVQIQNQESAIRQAKSEYNQAVESRKSIESSISSLEASLATATEEEAARINAALTSLRSQLEDAKAAEDDAELNLKSQEDILTQLEAKKSELEAQLESINNDKDQWETQLAQKYPQVEEYLNQYKEAKAQFESDKAAATSDAQAKVNAASEYLTNIENRINDFETDDKKVQGVNTTLSELGFDISDDTDNETGLDYDKKLASAILDAAKRYVGDCTKSTNMCARGVREALEDAFGVGDYQIFSGDAYQWAGYFNSNSDQWSNITDSYSDSSDLANLPAGAIVVWSKYNGGQYGHICIADGKGGEYSDFYRSKIITSFEDKGGTYQVFVPKT